MPRYFFHIHHHTVEIDDVGELLADRHAAWHEATITAGQMLQSLDGNLTPERAWRMEVTDESQNAIFILHIHAEKP
jgi:pyruvate kinase